MFKPFKKITENTKGNKEKFKLFDHVTHDQYGDGVINAIYPDKTYWVAFDKTVIRVNQSSLKAWPLITHSGESNYPTPF